MPMTCHFDCAAQDLAVRDVMIRLRAALVERVPCRDARSSVEIAVAEGLNNIVEHALCDQPQARIHVKLMVEGGQIFVRLRDEGRAMPGWRLPKGKPTDLNVGLQDLPEGGFGWGMIHMLADQLDYSRIDGVNRLKMWFHVDGSETPCARG
ncbi:ATP-binding protein [Aestuariivita boseongensis]|uniref:ATP-binding protein n=1 Tax=Aestuariivita boseongensis TaxID=1470562 RepID=UPI0009E65C40|nr:ATP-binding protein [Aestuariivita boseongensis]